MARGAYVEVERLARRRRGEAYRSYAQRELRQLLLSVVVTAIFIGIFVVVFLPWMLDTLSHAVTFRATP
jgi:Na+-driven multidrug efflux pump